MTRTIILLCLLLSAPLLIQAAPVVAFVDVNVIPMDRERILPHQTVIVRDGTIAEIGDAKRIKIPKTVAANPFSTPTLHLFKFTFGKGRREESFQAQPDIRFYPQKVVDQWMAVSKRYLATAAPIEKREKYIAIRNKIVKAIYDAGGRVMGANVSCARSR